MSILLDGTLGITTPGLTNTGTETIVNLTTTGNTILGDASTDTLNVGNGGLVKDASGNVGIGTASPSNKLSLKTTSGGCWLQTEDSVNTSGGNVNLFGSLGTGVAAVYTGGANPIAFYTNATERMRIDTSGNVGVGVTPSAWGSPLAHAIELAQGTGITAHSGSATSYYTSNAYYNGSNWIYKSSVKATLMTMSGSDGSFGWNTAPSGTAGNAITFTQAMSLDASGNLLVGQTAINSTVLGASIAGSTGIIQTAVASSSSGVSCYNLYSTTAGAYRFYVDMAGTIHATATTITAISDQRLKENVRPLENSLVTINSLNPVKFDWKAGKGLDKKDDVGFIAQEFETVFPNSVTESLAGEDKIAYKALNHGELIPTLVKAIQEQQALITSLTARLEVLEAK